LTRTDPNGITRSIDPDAALDLRRRIRRDRTDCLVARAAFLPAADRILIEGYFREGRTIKTLAEAADVPPRAMSRRIRRLSQRLLSDRFAFVLRNYESWSPARRRVATATILHGYSMRAAADRLRMSLYNVRRHSEAIRALYETDQRQRAARSTAYRSS